MSKLTKKRKEALEAYDTSEQYSLEDAVGLINKIAKAKFDETVEIHIRLGIDTRKSDQTVRGTTVLPHGTGKTPTIICFTKGERIKQAEEAGADYAGSDELIQKVKDGFSAFDIAVASPDMMADIGRHLGRILGSKMPNPRAGTVAPDVVQAVKDLKGGKMQFRADKQGVIHCPVGKVSFGKEKLEENLTTLLEAIVRAKPSSSKGVFLRGMHLTTTMGPAIKVDPMKTVATAL